MQNAIGTGGGPARGHVGDGSGCAAGKSWSATNPKRYASTGLGCTGPSLGIRRVGYGQQKERLGFTRVFVVPSTSPANNALLVEREAAFHALARAVRSLA